jgi:hypothetical protein
MDNKDWIEFKRMYMSKFNASSQVVELIASWEILLFCASGRSNLSISRFLDMDVDYITEVIQDNLKFQGFEYDLDLNPSSIFSRIGNFDEFVAEIKAVSPLAFDKELVLWYNVCNKFDSIRKEIDEFYESEPSRSA